MNVATTSEPHGSLSDGYFPHAGDPDEGSGAPDFEVGLTLSPASEPSDLENSKKFNVKTAFQSAI